MHSPEHKSLWTLPIKASLIWKGWLQNLQWMLETADSAEHIDFSSYTRTWDQV